MSSIRNITNLSKNKKSTTCGKYNTDVVANIYSTRKTPVGATAISPCSLVGVSRASCRLFRPVLVSPSLKSKFSVIGQADCYRPSNSVTCKVLWQGRQTHGSLGFWTKTDSILSSHSVHNMINSVRADSEYHDKRQVDRFRAFFRGFVNWHHRQLGRGDNLSFNQ